MYSNPVMLPDKKLRNTITLQVQVNPVGIETADGTEPAARKGNRLAKGETAYAGVSFLATKNGQTIYQVTDSRTSTEYDSDTLLAGIIRTATDEMTKNAKK